MPDTVFGPLVTGADVENAARDTLKAWARDYLAWAERLTGRDPQALPLPRSWITSPDLERWPEDQLPSVLLISPGLAEPPTRDGRGHYRAKFALGIAVVVSARDRAVTDELAKLYVAAFRAAILHHPSLGGFAEAVEWIDEAYDPLPGRARQLAVGQAEFRVEVRDVVAVKAGPSAPRPDPYTPHEDPPSVVTTDVTVRPQEVP